VAPMRRFLLMAVLLLWPAGFPAHAEIVDRIVGVVDGHVIAWSAALAEANYQAFGNGAEPVRALDGEELRKIVSQMIDQSLLENEMDRSLFSPPLGGAPEAKAAEAAKRFPDREAYLAALARFGLSEGEFKQRLGLENAILLFVEDHLRPQAHIEPAEIESYYRETLLPQISKEGKGSTPALSEVSAGIEEVLVQKEINRLLDEWLAQLKSRAKIKIFLEPGR
jgi:hypothetical protein